MLSVLLIVRQWPRGMSVLPATGSNLLKKYLDKWEWYKFSIWFISGAGFALLSLLNLRHRHPTLDTSSGKVIYRLSTWM